VEISTPRAIARRAFPFRRAVARLKWKAERGSKMTDAEIMRRAKAGDESALRALYLDWVNNFLTVAGFASYYGIGARSAECYIAWGRELHEAHCAALKAAQA
jgi:hypothetical protein